MLEAKSTGDQESKPTDISELWVLIVDDNQDMRDILRSLLRRLRVANIGEAESGAAALEKLADSRCDLMIVSMGMGKMNGIDLVHRVRTDPGGPNPDVPIIMTGALTDAESVVKARDAGIDEFIVIPVSYKVLKDRVISVANNPRPMLKSKAFTGPDRRRRSRNPDGTDRRKSPPQLSGRDPGAVSERQQ